jgi:arsenate reductase
MKVYHNPSCSKSRVCVEALKEKGIPFETCTYLKQPLNAEELMSLLTKLDMNPSALVRKNEPIYKEALKSGVLTEDEILHLMAEHPKLIERPIVERNGKAIVARPIERLALFLANN